jgi:transposase
VEQSYRYFVGVDGGWKDHKICVTDGAGETKLELVVRHRGDEIGRLADKLSELSEGEPCVIGVAIEVTHGAVVETLLERGFHVYSINPKQLDRFRDRFSVAGAKDDRLDAFVLATSLRTDNGRFRLLQNNEPLTVELRETVRIDGELRGEVVRLSNQLTEQLHRFFPQFLEFGSLADQPWLWDLLELVPTPESARVVRQKAITSILKKRRITRITARRVADILKRKPFVLAPGAVEAAAFHTAFLLPRLRLAFDQRAQCEKRMKKLLKQLAEPNSEDQGEKCGQRDVNVILSYPGLGTRIAATLLAEAEQALSTRAYNVLRSYAGAAPVTRQSGKRCLVTMRRACNARVREAVYHWARVSVQNDEPGKAHYDRLRAAGHSHARALRGVADRMLKVLCAMLRDGTLYNAELRHGFAASKA